MRLRRPVKCLLAMLVAGILAEPLAAHSAQEPAKKAQTAFDFKARMQEVADAWSTMDPSKAAPFYSKEPGNVFYDLAPLKYVGWDAYAVGVPDLLKDFASLKLTIGKDAKATRHGNAAWGTATFHADIVVKDGGKQALDGRWTFIWQRMGDEWLIVHEHVSVPMGPPPPPPPPPAARSGKKRAPPPPPPPPRP